MDTGHRTRLSLVRGKERFVLYCFLFEVGRWGGSRWEGRSRGELYIVTDRQQSVFFCFGLGICLFCVCCCWGELIGYPRKNIRYRRYVARGHGEVCFIRGYSISRVA